MLWGRKIELQLLGKDSIPWVEPKLVTFGILADWSGVWSDKGGEMGGRGLVSGCMEVSAGVKIFAHMIMLLEFTPREGALNDCQGKMMGEWTLAMSVSMMRLGGQEGGHAWALQQGHPLPKADFYHCQLFSLLPQSFMLRLPDT